MRLFVLAVFLLAISGAAAGSEPVEVLNSMECPCSVVDFGRYKDGGSVGGLLQCSKGDSLAFFWKSGMRPSEPATPLPPCLLYIRTDYYAHPIATPISANSIEERHLVSLLQCFVDSVFSRERQDEIIDQAVSWSKSWQEFASQFAPDELRAVDTLGLIYRIKKERDEFAGEQ